MEPAIETLPPEAPEVGPENNFDVQGFTRDIVGELQRKGYLPKDVGEAIMMAANPWVTLLTWLAKQAFPLLLIGEKEAFKLLTPQLEMLLQVVLQLFGEPMKVLSTLTGAYVKVFVDQQKGIAPGAAGKGPSGLQGGAAGLFDSILAPLGFLVGGANPATSGAGEKNAQFVLGSVVGIHLSTWMVNIISNLTGLGALKWINSFDDVITNAISTRSLNRLAMRPYITKFIGDPLERDLNVRLPLNTGSASNLIKGYIRGAVSRDELINKMRGLGFAEEIVEDLLLDTAKLLSVEAVVWLVNSGKWTESDAHEHLKQAGWPAELAPVVFELERSSLVRAQMRSLANSLVSAFEDRRIDNPTLRYLLGKMDLSQEEVNAFVLRGAVLQELPKRLSFAQVRQLYDASLVDLTYVERFLQEEGYSGEDADLLVLLEFTRKEEREARVAYQLEQRRIREDARIEREEAALAKQQAELLTLA